MDNDQKTAREDVLAEWHKMGGSVGRRQAEPSGTKPILLSASGRRVDTGGWGAEAFLRDQLQSPEGRRLLILEVED